MRMLMDYERVRLRERANDCRDLLARLGDSDDELDFHDQLAVQINSIEGILAADAKAQADFERRSKMRLVRGLERPKKRKVSRSFRLIEGGAA